ncbi:hypothetical protein AB0M46_03530 [Dactylosporangium sp. NPDC051485]|uniref:hypothetical protein n=1 Tax=Dactylosporangium sp. NPDC051485 TaxID=3154846 RepID=UPI00343EA6FB
MTRTPRMFAAGYLLLSLATLAVIVALRHNAAVVNAAVWIRGSIVVASAAVTNILALRGDVRRLRIISIVMVIAITVIVAVPGPFPLWLKIEQVACGLLLVGVAATLPRKARRAGTAVADATYPDASPVGR